MDGPRLTLRQQVLELLESGEWGFDELRRELGCSVARLEGDLRHLERSLQARGRRLRVAPAACAACGFVFEGRARKRFYAPSRCPSCRSERIRDPRLSVGS